ncbi:class I SAM-dependent methyltransferase [Nocardioides sediminis]|uniref:class I SAM-dependent methyltransferase n=1 Tax=Nocardioides sediminis TaxID=433648 RepID=UPI000D310202|nr:methyltransferase domain-containing protein [Nocardioides sediminis]
MSESSAGREATDSPGGIAGVFDRAAATYDQVGVRFFGIVAEHLVDRTAPRPGERVLDVGCGRGASALRAARAVGPGGRVLATDLAPRMVEGLRGLATDLPWLESAVGDAADPPAGPWDVVQASLVLFFLPDLRAALDRYREVLSPDGRLGLTWFGAVDTSWEAVHTAVVGGLPEADRPPRVTTAGPFSSVASLEDLLREHGYDDVVTTERRVDVAFTGPGQWWDWSWSQGQRVLLEAHERNGTLAALREAVDPLLEEWAAEDRLTWWTDVRCTTARRA